jgi:signal transduction histidine kinase
MGALVEDILYLAREGGSAGTLEPARVGELVRGCWGTIETNGARLVVETDRTVEADRGQLRRLLENLLANAVEHGGPEVTVTVGDCEEGFYVADDGPGIDDSVRDELFEAGYSTSPDGTGFGLRIVNQIADGHGWDVSVTDSESGGARFEVTGVEEA